MTVVERTLGPRGLRTLLDRVADEARTRSPDTLTPTEKAILSRSDNLRKGGRPPAGATQALLQELMTTKVVLACALAEIVNDDDLSNYPAPVADAVALARQIIERASQ
jgi:hypothetical protein